MEIGTGILGWSPRQFWRATLPELLAAYRGYRQREDKEDLRAGMVVAAIYEQNRNPDKRPDPITVYDFFPNLRPKQEVIAEEEDDEEPTLEEMQDYFRKLKASTSNDGGNPPDSAS